VRVDGVQGGTAGAGTGRRRCSAPVVASTRAARLRGARHGVRVAVVTRQGTARMVGGRSASSAWRAAGRQATSATRPASSSRLQRERGEGRERVE